MGTKLERKEKKGSATVDQVSGVGREELDEEDKRE